ncbi:LEM domain-containing protein 1 [Electrophorus electricus]|uniref:LEM domain-containing protein 1 n=1 Tax=Electrophorus electricus TaxID=8005 RepID=UPI0015D04215|nr:LEM domain-containing protein 1 [Electrophorus electricus]
MPVFAEDPGQFSKQRLRSELISHNVELPSRESKKQVYVELYMKHVGNEFTADFSSDDEDQIQNGDGETEEEWSSDMVNLSSLTDDQLKDKLLEYGIKAGPILASTRDLYERKLHRLLVHAPEHGGSNAADARHYSESEEEEGDEDEESGSELYGSKMPSHAETSATAGSVGLSNQSKEMFYPQCFFPPVRQGNNQQRSLGSSGNSSQFFSITQLVAEGSNRLSPQSRPAGTERGCIYTPVASRGQWDLQRLSKNTMTDASLFLTPECLTHQKQTATVQPAAEPITDVLMELFPDAVVTPTGITATKRRPIKGAAGRPVQFKYPETLMSPTAQVRQEIRQRLVPLWVQIFVFLLLAGLLYLIYVLMENPSENSFSALLDSPSQEAVRDEATLSRSCKS